MCYLPFLQRATRPYALLGATEEKLPFLLV